VGSSASTSRTTVTATTSTPLSSDSSANLSITGYKSYFLLKITVSAPAWVVLYTDTSSRTNDSTRLITEDPLPESGVIAEVVTTTNNQTVTFAPAILGFNNSSPVSTTIFAKIQNRSGSTQSIQVTLTLIQLET